MEIDNGKKYNEAVKVHATVVETMKGVEYGLLKDGETFYRMGMELAPRDGITFSMRDAYEIHRFLSSRDTYWKERVRQEIVEAVDLTKREIKHRVETYFKNAYLSLKQQGGVHIHLEEIQEIIDDSTPPGFALTLPITDEV